MTDLAAAFWRYVDAEPDAAAAHFASGPTSHGLTRAALAQSALRCLRQLSEHGVGAGDRVLIALPAGPAFLAHFWGILLAGAAAAPLPPGPDLRRRPQHAAALLATVMTSSAPRLVIGDPDALEPLAGGVPVLDPEAYRDATPASPQVAPRPDDLAIVQHTSGSAGEPKGCELTHAAVLANAEALVGLNGVAPGDTGVCWLPLHHDMGLMSGVVTPVVGLAATHLSPPTRFMGNPLSWLADLSAFSRTHTAAPTFALALVLQRMGRRSLDHLRLGRVVSLLCGAEPIDPAVARAFLARLAPFGLSPAAFHAAYGLSETTVLATLRPGGLRVDRIDRAALQDAGCAKPATAGDALEFVSVGRPPRGSELRIVDAHGEVVAGRRTGEVQLRGPSCMRGYAGLAAGSADAFDGDWLRTGDCGYLADGELYLTGRLKDLIIVGGRKVAPSSIEQAAARDPHLAGARVSAFGSTGVLGTEDIHVAVELRGAHDAAAIRHAVERACFEVSGAFPAAVWIVPRGTVPRTSSGKPRRGLLQGMLLRGDLAASNDDALPIPHTEPGHGLTG